MLTEGTDTKLALTRKNFPFLPPARQQAKPRADDRRSGPAPKPHCLPGSRLETNAFARQLRTFVGVAESSASVSAEAIHAGFWAASVCQLFRVAARQYPAPGSSAAGTAGSRETSRCLPARRGGQGRDASTSATGSARLLG